MSQPFQNEYPSKPPKQNGQASNVVYGTPIVQGQHPPQGQTASGAYGGAPPAGYPNNAANGPYGNAPQGYYPPPTNQPVYYYPAQQPYQQPYQQSTGPGADTLCTACLAALCCCCLMDMVF
jgi:hypothetical protein